MNKQAPSPLRIGAMVGFALSCFGLLLFLWLAFGGPIPLKPKGYRFDIAFEEATQLAVEADVRVAGVPVGKVRAKQRDPNANRTLATIEIESKYAPISSDARATLRQKTLLGETFVELTLGSPQAEPLPEGGVIDNRQVPAGVELDEILDTLDPYTRQAFRTWQQDLGDSVDGRGRDLNDSFGTLPYFVQAGGDLTEELDLQRQALRQLIKGTGVVFGALTEREDQLRRLITSQDDVFSAIAAEQESWAETFNIFPTFLDESKATFERLQAFSIKARPVVRDLEPAMRDLRTTLDAVGDFAPDLERFFVRFDPLIDLSKKSLPASTEILRSLRPLLGELGPFLQQFNPILEYIAVHQYTLTDMFANLGVATAAKVKTPAAGQLGHYLRQFGPQGTESAAIFPTRLSSNRGNAYLNPLGVLTSPEAAEFKILPSFDCNNSGGEKKPGGGPPATPGCRVQKPFTFRGNPTSTYPRLTEKSYAE